MHVRTWASKTPTRNKTLTRNAVPDDPFRLLSVLSNLFRARIMIGRDSYSSDTCTENNMRTP